MTVKNTRDNMFAGNRRVMHFTIRDEAAALLDLVGHTAVWKLARNNEAKSPVVLTKTSAAGDITFVAPTTLGELNLVLAEGATTTLLGIYYWELELTNGSGYTNVVANGELEIKKNL